MIISWLVSRSSFRPGQGTHQRPFCLAKSLSVAPKVPFANKMMTAVSPNLYRIRITDSTNSHVNILTIKLTVTCDNFVASLTKLASSRPRGSSGTHQGCHQGCHHFDESLGRDETSSVRLATKLSQ